MMNRLLGLLMVMGLWIGCDGDRDNPLDSATPTGTDENELLVWTITWEDGNVKEEYQYYNHPESGKRIKEGWYNSYFIGWNEGRGYYREVGICRENERVGEWIFYGYGLRDDEYVSYELKGTYKDGMPWSGGFLQYTLPPSPDRVWWEMHLKDGKLHGKHVEYGEDKDTLLWGVLDESCWNMGKRVDCPLDD